MYTPSFCLCVSSDLCYSSQIYAQPGDMIYGQPNRCLNIAELGREVSSLSNFIALLGNHFV